MAKKKTVVDFMRMKKEGEQVTWVTAYDYPTASFAEQAGIDMILAGDSLNGCFGQVALIRQKWMTVFIVRLFKRRFNTWIVGDMPLCHTRFLMRMRCKCRTVH